MVKHVSYTQANYTTPEDCVMGIREYVDLGWRVSQIRGTRHGPFAVLFRMDDPSSPSQADADRAAAQPPVAPTTVCGKYPEITGRSDRCSPGRNRFWSSKRI
ncbi:MAG: hypothetical protein ABI782_10625 [Anaerolineaceae bacterium]